MRIGLIGGGPAGISLARLLKEFGLNDITVFEANDKVGGKSSTYQFGNSVAELGTCYTTLAHRRVKKWVREKSLHLDRIGTMKFDGKNFMNYVNSAGGPPFALQLLRFHLDGRRLLRQMSVANPPAEVCDEAASSIGEWVRKRNLPKVELFLHRMITLQGYGYLNETSAFQAHQWCDGRLILSGALNQVHMIREGWSQLWNLLADDINVRLSTPVESVERSKDGIIVNSSSGFEKFDHIVCAIPLDEFGKLCRQTPDEKFVNSNIDWQGYTTSLIASRNWFQDWDVEAYSSPVRPGASYGELLGARFEGTEDELGGNLYITGQLPGELTSAELKELVLADLERHGVDVTNFIEQRRWKYFPRYKSAGLRAGLVQHMRQMQGKNNTWYTGATFSFEAVSHIVEFNALLARQIVQSAGCQRKRGMLR
jgi:predicted NAD/FAD-binding protein